MKEKSPHRLTHAEFALGDESTLKQFTKGDIVLRQGIPHIILENNEQKLDAGLVLIANLVTGSCWSAPGSEKVWPCFDAQLEIHTKRRQSP